MYLLIGLLGIVFFAGNSTQSAIALSDIGQKLDTLVPNFGQDAIDRLTSVADALTNVGITGNLQLICLAQILHETGLFRPDLANYHLMDQFNYAGLKDTSGEYLALSSYDDFATHYKNFLNHYPGTLTATTPAQFVNALVANPQHMYFTDGKGVYLKDVSHYYNLLNDL